MEISDINENYTVDGAAATQVQYDAVVARNARLEPLSDWTGQDDRAATVDQLLATLAQ